MEKKTGTYRNSDEEIHHEENIRRLRLLFDIKQEAFAFKPGPGWVQKKVSILEAKSAIDMRTIIHVAEVLEVSPDVITGCTRASFVAAMSRGGQKDCVSYVLKVERRVTKDLRLTMT